MNIVTVSQKAKEALKSHAKQEAQVLGWPYVVRKGQSLPKLQEQYKADSILNFQNTGPSLYTGPGKEHHFHLSMAQLRILRLERGEQDHLVEAVKIESPEQFSILDCTLGLASDSIIMTYAYPEARITGLEAALPLWYITKYGLQHFVHDNKEVTNALRRIEAIHGNYIDYLAQADNDSFEVIYFDPMFEKPIEESPQFLSLRGHIHEEPLSIDSFHQACRVAKYKVVIKERPFASIFKILQPHEWVGGKYSRIGYGVYYVERI